MDGYFPASATHGGGDFAAEELGGGAGDEDGVARGIEQPADEAFPAWDELDLVEKPGDGVLGAGLGLGVKAGLGVGDGSEVGSGEAVEALVLEVKIDSVASRGATGEEVGTALVQVGGLAGTTHADDADGFVFEAG
jgi:hypothetical protein